MRNTNSILEAEGRTLVRLCPDTTQTQAHTRPKSAVLHQNLTQNRIFKLLILRHRAAAACMMIPSEEKLDWCR